MIYPIDVPELSLFTRKVYLPKGDKVGRGNLVFLYTKSVKDTISEINSNENYTPISNYTHYFYNFTYSGVLKGKRFFIRDTSKQSIYEKVKKETNLTTVPAVTLNGFDRNCYFEMSKYLQIYHEITDKFDPRSRVMLFWTYFNQIISTEYLTEYRDKYIIINAEKYANAFDGKLTENLSNPLYMIYYTLLKYPENCASFDHDIYIYSGVKSIKINPSHIRIKGKGTGDYEDASRVAAKFKTLLMRLLPNKASNIENSSDEKTLDKEETAAVVANNLIEQFNFTGDKEKILSDSDIPSVIDPVEKRVDSGDTIDNAIKNKAMKASEVTTNQEEAERLAKEEIERDKKLLEDMYSKAIENNKPVSSASSARDKKIREEQGSITVKGVTIDKLKKVQSAHMPIPTTDVSKVMNTTNENMKNIKYANFDKVYEQNIMSKDIVNSFTSLNDKSIGLTIIKYEVKDTSDELNYKETHTVVLEDVNRQRHTISVDIPKFIDDRFMWIGGAKKLILNQQFLYPVVKSGPDKVQIVTNYNKMFIERFGTKSITSLERLKKLISIETGVCEFFTVGYAFKLNADYITTVEYDELSKQFTKFETDTCELFFNQEEATKVADEKGVHIGANDIFIGFRNKKPVLIDTDTQKTEDGDSISDIILNELPEEFRKRFESIKAPKRLMYSAATTMEQKVSLGLLMGFWEGLGSVMKELKLNYRLEKSIPKALKSNESYLQFKDCVLVYEENVAQSLVMNGIRLIETREYELAQMESKEPYMDYLVKVYGKRNIANALMNTYEFTIDPITKEILEDLNLPTTLVPLCIYANALLADSQFTHDYNQKLCRTRRAEIIPAILYDSIAKNYIQYKNSNGKKKLSIPRDIVIKKLLALPTVEEYSTLNPVLELERTHTTMYKGWRGINEDRSYTQDKRVYDDSMVGIMGLTTSPDGSVGVQKTLTLEPRITTGRGYLVNGEERDGLKDVNLFSPGEMLVPLALRQDDPTRSGQWLDL